MSLRKSVLIDQDKDSQAASIATFNYGTFVQRDLVEGIQYPIAYRPVARLTTSENLTSDVSSDNVFSVDECEKYGIYEDEKFLSDGSAWSPGGDVSEPGEASMA